MGQKQILLIDDEATIVRPLKDVLELEGYTVDVCTSGEDALNLLNQNLYQLVFVDIRMEGKITGTDILQEMKKNKKWPILAVISATPKEEVKLILREYQVDEIVRAVLEKPEDVRPESLILFIKQQLQQERKKQDE